MQIRPTREGDIPSIMAIFEHGRQVQRQTGNLNQWTDGHPKLELIQQDIESGSSYVCVIESQDLDSNLEPGTIVATFAAIEGRDPTYGYIEGAGWLNDDDYVTIHRISTNGLIKGAGQVCMEWVLHNYDNVRIDTHHLNQPMIHVIEKYQFDYCGVIYIADGTARNAYHYTESK